MTDEIQHYGNRNSGRYRRGSKNNALREGGMSNYKTHEKFEKEVQKTRLKNEKFLRNGYKKLSKMTPKQADLFLRKAKRLQKGDELADAKLKAIRDEKIASIDLNKSKIEGIDAVMKITKSTLSLADKVKSGGSPDYYKDIADGAVAVSKATKAIKQHQAETVKQLNKNTKQEAAPAVKDVERYIRLTRASEKEARKRLKNIRSLSTSGKGIVTDGVKLLTKYEKIKDGS